MPAFDKNSVQIEYPYEINPIETDDTPLQPCPHCGHLMERKHRSACFSCKRRIPPVGARQGWDPKIHNAFAEISPLVVRRQEVRETKFALTRLPYWELLRECRKVAIAAAAVAGLFYIAPYAGRAIFGTEQYNKMVAEATYMVTPPSLEAPAK